MNKYIGVIILVVGLLFSVITHEYFHYLIHKDNITSISIFPDYNTIVNIKFKASSGYNVLLEEVLAYSISAITFSIATYFGLPKIINKG